MNLYVAYWNPNGTNDLLVCDENHQILECIEEATFGIDVTRYNSGHTILVADDRQVFSARSKDAAQLLECFTQVQAVTLKDLKKRLALSPVDPQGKNVMRRLKAAGVKL